MAPEGRTVVGGVSGPDRDADDVGDGCGSAMQSHEGLREDRREASQAAALRFYEMGWEAEICYRGYRQTLEQPKLRSDPPEQARREAFWDMTAMPLFGLMSPEALLKRKPDRKTSASRPLGIGFAEP